MVDHRTAAIRKRKIVTYLKEGTPLHEVIKLVPGVSLTRARQIVSRARKLGQLPPRELKVANLRLMRVIDERRLQLGLSVRALCAAAHMDRSTYYRLVKARNLSFRLSTIEPLAAAVGLELTLVPVRIEDNAY